MDRQRIASRHWRPPQQRALRRALRHVLRSPQRICLLHEPARRARRLFRGGRRRVEHRLESGVDFEDRTLRWRVDGRDGHPVQVAPLHRRPESGLGPSDAPVHPAQKRMGLPHAGAAHSGRPSSVESRLIRRHAGWPRPPRSGQEYRTQALRGRAQHDGQGAQTAGEQRVHQRDRRRHQVRGHAEPHGGPHPQHRLRPGRDR